MASLKTRLIWTLLVLTVVAWIASALLTFGFVSRVMLDQVDRQLTQYSGLLNYMTRVFARRVDEGEPLAEPWLSGEFETAHLQPMVIDAPTQDGFSPALNIWLEDSLIAVMSDSPRFDRPTVEGFAFVEDEPDGTRWRLLTRHDETTGLWIRVGIELDGARRAMMAMLGRAMLPLLLVLPLTVGLLYFGVSRGLSPLKSLAGQIAKRNAGLLDPLDPAGAPAEMHGVVASLNGLLQRLAFALEGEQRFTANAAHELTTPLAAIKTEVQLCQMQLVDEGGRAMLDRIARRVDRAAHTVDQLLTLARLDPEVEPIRQSLSLSALLGEVLADTVHLAAARGLVLDRQDTGDVHVDGNAEALAILLRNLLVNAYRYASENSLVQLSLRDEGGARLTIGNDCEPLSAREFARIDERFYRVPGSPGQGAGLGLSIVARIARLHGATVDIAPLPSGRGFCVSLGFPAAVRPDPGGHGPHPAGPDGRR